MRTQRNLYKAGSWAFIAVGSGHLLTHWLAPKTGAQETMLNAMREFVIAMPGSSGNLYLYHTGFSLMMGGLLIAYGIQALLTLSEQALQDRRLLAFHVLASALSVAVSIMYFFVVPVALMAVSLSAFAYCLLIAQKNQSRTEHPI